MHAYANAPIPVEGTPVKRGFPYKGLKGLQYGHLKVFIFAVRCTVIETIHPLAMVDDYM